MADERPVGLVLIMMVSGIIIGAAWAFTGHSLPLPSIAGSVAGLGIVFAVLAGVQLLVLARLDAFRSDATAAISVTRWLSIIVLLGAVTGIILATTGTQFGIIRLEPAVTGLGITAAVLATTLAMTLYMLRTPPPALPADEASHVLTIDGVTPQAATRLNAYGIYTASQLRAGDARVIAAQIGVAHEDVEAWQARA